MKRKDFRGVTGGVIDLEQLIGQGGGGIGQVSGEHDILRQVYDKGSANDHPRGGTRSVFHRKRMKTDSRALQVRLVLFVPMVAA